MYFQDLEKNGTDTTRLRRKHAEALERMSEPEESSTNTDFKPPEFIDKIPVRLVTKNNKVKVKICSELATLHEKYYSKGKMPKIEERLKALKAVGYPDEVLLKVLNNHEKRLKERPENEKFINAIFGEYTDKRPTAPKKKNLYQVLKIKRPTYATIDNDEDNEEDAISDDEGLFQPEADS